MAEKQLISLRLKALEQSLAIGAANVLEQFWQEVTEKHTPLIEEISDDGTNLLVTFLWRGYNIQNVTLFSYLFNSADGFALILLTQLPGSDVWYYSSL